MVLLSYCYSYLLGTKDARGLANGTLWPIHYPNALKGKDINVKENFPLKCDMIKASGLHEALIICPGHILDLKLTQLD